MASQGAKWRPATTSALTSAIVRLPQTLHQRSSVHWLDHPPGLAAYIVVHILLLIDFPVACQVQSPGAAKL
jgi:hypothetical protein